MRIKKIKRGSLEFMVRPDTLDEWVVDEVLQFSEYVIPLDIRAHDRVLDIGLNIGTFTVLAGMIGADVVGYEPDIENFELAEKNIKLNNLKCLAINKGVSGRSGKVKLYLNEKKNRGSHSITPVKGRRAIDIELVGINQILKEGNFNKLKIDCEGEEYEILKAVTDFKGIERIRMEWHRKILKDEKNIKFNEVLSHLILHGFKVIGKRNAKGWTQMLTAIKKLEL